MIPERSAPLAQSAEAEAVTEVYDQLSEAIRDGDLQAVRVAWKTLDDLLRAGAELPEPWRR